MKFSDVWTGTYVTFVKEKEKGEIYAWGLNNYYQLGMKRQNKDDYYMKKVTKILEMNGSKEFI